LTITSAAIGIIRKVLEHDSMLYSLFSIDGFKLLQINPSTGKSIIYDNLNVNHELKNIVISGTMLQMIGMKYTSPQEGVGIINNAEIEKIEGLFFLERL